IEDFFEAQIAVAKAIQFRYRADLLSEPSDEKPKDLQKEVRPALLDLGDQIIEQIMMYIRTHGSIEPTLFSEFDATINIKYVTTSDKKLLFKALRKVKRLPVK
ncbi:MAG: chorismate mutase, partial [Gammaproteobacteria bacterium]|nr:chorismate mutase [Gammaproteobacteria bacterium]MCP3890280.1 chorismate mutase [Desulfobulbaceae bacterium]